MQFERPHSEVGRQPKTPFETPLVPTEQLTKLPQNEQREIIEKTGLEVLTALAEAGGKEYEDVNELYRSLGAEKLIVRREDPTKLVETLVKHDPFSISFPTESKYSNAVLWQPELQEHGLTNAYNEGYGSRNGIVTVVGIRPQPDMAIEKLPDASQTFAGLDRRHVYSVSGTVHPEDIAFVMIRIPAYAYPAEMLTEEEEELLFEYEQKQRSGMRANPPFVHRGFLFNKSESTKH